MIVAGGALTGDRGTKRQQEERLVTLPVSIEDIFPTTLDLAGVVPASHLPGASLAPLLGPAKGTSLTRDAVFLEYVEEHRYSHKSIPPWRAIRTERYCYSITQNVPWMLFDLANDSYEQHNLVADPASRRLRLTLHERLMDHLLRIGDPFARIYRLGANA